MAAAVFRDYDQQALDRAYDNRGRIADADACKAAQAAASDEAKESFSCRLDVPYGPGTTDRLDIYHGDGPAPRPIHLFFHGGYWKWNTKDDFGFAATPFVPYGVTVVVVEYPLIPSVRMDGLIERCREALAWTWRNAASFDGDPARITVSGHSAGGHITAIMLATDWPGYAAGLPGDLVKAGCSISGVSDLEPVRLSFQNAELRFSHDEAAAFSTLAMDPGHPGPFLIVAGGDEGSEFIRQSTDLAEAWAAKGMDCRSWVMPGKHHYTTINQYLDPDSELSRAVRALIGVG